MAYKHECSICHEPYEGYGNNAQPVNNGRCCDDCNWRYVMSQRFHTMGIELTPAALEKMRNDITDHKGHAAPSDGGSV